MYVHCAYYHIFKLCYNKFGTEGVERRSTSTIYKIKLWAPRHEGVLGEWRMGRRAGLDVMVKRKIPTPWRVWNPLSSIP